MSVTIHPQAIVSKSATLSQGVEVGPFSLIEDNVTIGKDTKIGPGCFITGSTTIGQNCQIFKGAVIGSPPQDLKYNGQHSYIEIGNFNVIREYVTVNPGTEEGSKTQIGSNNLIMAYSHIAHNCKVGNHCVLANAATLAGFVEIEDKVIVGGLVAIHQFCRVGKLAIIGGCSKVVQDIPPFSMADGHPAKIKGLNSVGLKRAEVSADTIQTLKKAFKILFFENHSFDAARKLVEKDLSISPNIEYLLSFLQSTQRGIAK